MTDAVVTRVYLGNFSNANTKCQSSIEHSTMKTVEITSYAILLLLSIAGNLLMLAAVYKNRRTQANVNYLIGNMAASDILLVLFGIPRCIQEIFMGEQVNDAFSVILCKFAPFTNGVSTAVSMLTLLVIAFERFHAIVYSMKPPLIDKRKCFRIIFMCWLTGVVISSINLFIFKLEQLGEITNCKYSWEPIIDSNQGMKIFALSFLVLFIVMPLTVLTALYSVLIVSLQRQKAFVNRPLEERRRRTSENRRVIFMLVTIVVVFFSAWIPYLVIHIFLFIFSWNFSIPCELKNGAFGAQFLSFSYSALNPLIYYRFSENYRKSIKQILFCPVL